MKCVVLAAMLAVLLEPAVGSRSTTSWANSSAFSFARELAQGNSTIVVPGNHSIAGEFEEYKSAPLELTR
jgi:hypothetical protein